MGRQSELKLNKPVAPHQEGAASLRPCRAQAEIGNSLRCLLFAFLSLVCAESLEALLDRD